MALSSGFSFTVDQNQFERAKQTLSAKELKKAMFVAVRETAKGAKTDIRKVIEQKTTLQSKYINRVISAGRPVGDPPTATVTISHRLIPLVGYKVSGTKRGGVTFETSKDRPIQILRHAFMARVRSAQQEAGGFAGHRGVFFRARHLPAKGPNVGKKRKLTKRGFAGHLAIEERFGPAVTDLVSQQEIGTIVTNSIGTRLAKEFNSQFQRFTGGQRLSPTAKAA